MTDDITWPERVKLVTHLLLRLNISAIVQDKDNRKRPSAVQWSCDQWRHVTRRGQGRDPEMFEAQYLSDRARWWLGINWSPIGKGHLRFQWSRDWWHHVILGVKFVTQLTNRGLNAKWAEQWDRYHVSQNAFLVLTYFLPYLPFSLRIRPLYFQAGRHKRQPNLGFLVVSVCFILWYFAFLMRVCLFSISFTFVLV